MDYRDELTAALARIAALESERQSPHTEELTHLRKANEGLRSEVRRLKALHQQALDDVESLRSEMPLADGTMPTVRERNREASPVLTGERAGALCDACATQGLAREVFYLAGEPTKLGRLVVCTACEAIGLLRKRSRERENQRETTNVSANESGTKPE